MLLYEDVQLEKKKFIMEAILLNDFDVIHSIYFKFICIDITELMHKACIHTHQASTHV